jgi:hypothetical protein
LVVLNHGHSNIAWAIQQAALHFAGLTYRRKPCQSQVGLFQGEEGTGEASPNSENPSEAMLDAEET